MSLSQPSFGEMLKRARRAAGLTQEALATRAGLSGRVISDLERHVQHAPRPATVRLLVEALPISASERAFLIELATASSVDASLQVTEAAAPRAPTMVDRVSERSTLEALLSGGPATLFFQGDPGIGKTRMLDEAARLGSQHGWHVLRGSAWAPGPLRAEDPVVAALRRDIESRSPVELRHAVNRCHALVQILPELSDLGLLTPSTLEPAPHVVARDVAHYLRNVAGPDGTLLLLDDLHLADVPQLELLGHLIEMIGTLRLGIIGAYRPSHGGREPYLHSVLIRPASRQAVRHLVLPPLSTTAAAELLSSLTIPTAKDLEPGHQSHQLRNCGGVPLYLVAVAAEPLADVPWVVREHVVERVRMLPHGQMVLECIAVAGEQAELSLVAKMTGGLEADVLETLDGACREGLLVAEGAAYRFGCPLIGRVIAQRLSHARRAALTRRAYDYTNQPSQPQIGRWSGPHQERAHHIAVLRAHRQKTSS